MSISKKLRFEIFKRDSFTCKYCGSKSPEVVLEIDHIIPKSKGGTNGEMNLTTSCYSCNRGKRDTKLSECITGEDPHDKAIELLERERQLAEYNVLLARVEERVEEDLEFVLSETGITEWVGRQIRGSLRDNSKYVVIEALGVATAKLGRGRDCIPYFYGVLKHMRKDKCLEQGS